MSMNEWEVNIIISQKNLIKTKDIQEKLNKLRVLYELNERKNNELMLWKKIRRLMNMTEKLTRQRVNALMINQWMKNQLKRLKKIMCRVEKKFAKEKKWVNSWAKRTSEKSMILFRSHLAFSIDMSSSMQNHCKKLEVKIFIKEKEKIKRIMMITTKNIVK